MRAQTIVAAFALGLLGAAACSRPPPPPRPPVAEEPIGLAPGGTAAPGEPAAPGGDDSNPAPAEESTDDSEVVFPAASLPPGGVHAVDAGALLSKARELSGLGDSARLASLLIEGVGPVGLIDLAPSGAPSRIEYRFVSAQGPVPDGGPVQVGASVVSVVVDSAGMHAPAAAVSDTEPRGVPDPRCSAKQVWDAALRAHAPKEALATLAYDGATWHFRAAGSDAEILVRDGPCSLAAAPRAAGASHPASAPAKKKK